MAALTVADELAEAGHKVPPAGGGDRRLAGRARRRRRPRQGGLRRGGRRLQFGGRAHRGHHPASSMPRSATASRSDSPIRSRDSGSVHLRHCSRDERCRMAPPDTHYIAPCGAAGCVRRHIPRGLTILTGAVPGRARGFGHMAPTYLCRFPGSVLRRPSRLRTFAFAMSDSTRDRRYSAKPICAPQRWRGAMRCRPASAHAAAETIAARAVSGRVQARRDRLRLHADARARSIRCRCCASSPPPARSSRCR